MNIRSQKGSHVGVVLSFVVFTSFLIFFYIISQPILLTQKSKDVSLTALRDSLFQELFATVTETIVDLNGSVSSSCVVLDNIGGNGLSLVHDSDGTLLQAQTSIIDDDDLIIERSQERFLFILSSEDFVPLEIIPPEGSCETLTEEEGGYTIATQFMSTHLFEQNVLDLQERYTSNYVSLKDDLHIPKGSDFGFGFTYANGTTIETDEQDIKVTITSKQEPLPYFDSNGTLQQGTLIMKIW